jgi:hypothetical protein
MRRAISGEDEETPESAASAWWMAPMIAWLAVS